MLQAECPGAGCPRVPAPHMIVSANVHLLHRRPIRPCPSCLPSTSSSPVLTSFGSPIVWQVPPVLVAATSARPSPRSRRSAPRPAPPAPPSISSRSRACLTPGSSHPRAPSGAYTWAPPSARRTSRRPLGRDTDPTKKRTLLPILESRPPSAHQQQQQPAGRPGRMCEDESADGVEHGVLPTNAPAPLVYAMLEARGGSGQDRHRARRRHRHVIDVPGDRLVAHGATSSSKERHVVVVGDLLLLLLEH
eukprot:7311420-Prymnesium_polylepis.1